ncbi:MAG: MFS transporter [Chloroflexota bacterium]|nr:MFS transporter [Chloroflexota bacterium]
MPVRRLLAISVPWFGLSMLGDGLSALVLPYLLLLLVNADAQATVLGVATLAGLSLGMLIQPLAGAVSDRRGSRRPLLLGGMGLAVVGLGGLAFGPVIGLAGVLGLYLLATSGANVAQSGQQALIPDQVPAASRGRAAGLKGVMDVGGAFAAFAVLAAFLSEGMFSSAMLVLVAAFAVTIGAGVLPRPPSGAERAGPERVRPSVLWRDLGRTGPFTMLLLVRFCVLLGVYAVGRFLLLFIAHRLNLEPEAAAAEAGVVLAVLALLTAGASIPAGWAADRLGRRPTMAGGAVLAAAGIGLLVVATDTTQIMLFGIPLALGTAAFGAGSWAMATDLVSPSAAGRQMGVANYATAGAAAAAGLLGPLVDAVERAVPGLGYALLMLLAATAALVGGGLALGLPDTSRASAAAATPSIPTAPAQGKD